MEKHATLKKHIEQTGYRASVRTVKEFRFRTLPFDINIRRDKKGEFFAIDLLENIEASVMDVSGDHALLLFKDPTKDPNKFDKYKALIGHDERQLFVAAIPNGPVSTVNQAKEALKPIKVQKLDRGAKDPHRRKTPKRVRQGDFFFVPVDLNNIKSEQLVVFNKEPINRGPGRSHICEELVRFGGRDVYTHIKFRGRTFTEQQKKELFLDDPNAPRSGWVARRVGARVYVRGKIRHPEHKTLNLRGWHEVIPNTEAGWLKEISFID